MDASRVVVITHGRLLNVLTWCSWKTYVRSAHLPMCFLKRPPSHPHLCNAMQDPLLSLALPQYLTLATIQHVPACSFQVLALSDFLKLEFTTQNVC